MALRRPWDGLRRLGASALNARGASLNACFSSVPTTNIGYVRIGFNVGCGDNLALRARVFDSPAGHTFMDNCPHTLSSLESFGEEVYGSLAKPLPSSRKQPKIPCGGLAYSDQGQYLCIFFGQTPAWPVEYFAQIEVGWEELIGPKWQNLTVTKEDPLALESY